MSSNFETHTLIAGIEKIVLPVQKSRRFMDELKTSAVGTGIVSSWCFLGSLTFGPIGLLCGTVAGGVGTYFLTKNVQNKRPLYFSEAGEKKQLEICAEVMKVFKDAGNNDFSFLATEMKIDKDFKKKIIEIAIANLE